MRLFKNTRPNSGEIAAGYVTIAHKPDTHEAMRIVLKGGDDTYGLYLNEDDLRVVINALLKGEGIYPFASIDEVQALRRLITQWRTEADQAAIAASRGSGEISPQARAAVDEALIKARADLHSMNPSAEATTETIQKENVVHWTKDGVPQLQDADGHKYALLAVPMVEPQRDPLAERANYLLGQIMDAEAYYHTREQTMAEAHKNRIAELRAELQQVLMAVDYENGAAFIAGSDDWDANR